MTTAVRHRVERDVISMFRSNELKWSGDVDDAEEGVWRRDAAVLIISTSDLTRLFATRRETLQSCCSI